MVSMLIIGAELLFGTGTSISDEEGLLALVDPMQDRFGLLARWAFLIGFWAVATGAMLALVSAFLYALTLITSRQLSTTEPSHTILFYYSVSVLLATLLVSTLIPSHAPRSSPRWAR